MKKKVSDLYSKGIDFTKINEWQNAAIFFWKALACGDRYAAGNLYSIFKNGNDFNIKKNEEAANVFKKLNNLLVTNFSEPINDDSIEYKLSRISCEALDKFDGSVTNDDIKEQVRLCDLEICQKFGSNYYNMFDLANAMPESEINLSGYNDCYGCSIL